MRRLFRRINDFLQLAREALHLFVARLGKSRALTRSLRAPARPTYVAFLDILGFKSVLEDWDAAIRYYSLFAGGVVPIGADLVSLARAALLPTARPSRVGVRVISDSVIVTCDDAFSLLMQVSNIQLYGLVSGVSLRGCIAYGRHLEAEGRGDFYVVSEALRDAYVGETTVAKVPRIVLLSKTLDQISQQFGSPLPPPAWQKLLVQGEDDVWFANPFLAFDSLTSELSESINRKLREHASSQHLPKYLWLADLFNFMTWRPERFGEARYYYSKNPQFLRDLESRAEAQKQYGGSVSPAESWKYSATYNTFFQLVYSTYSVPMIEWWGAPLTLPFEKNIRAFRSARSDEEGVRHDER